LAHNSWPGNLGVLPAGTVAFHINADIADAVARYQSATGDEAFERETGIELLVETARLWRSLGHYDAYGRFRIDGVTGPDEYSAIADNNIYTNLMAQKNLLAAADAVERPPERARELGVGQEEVVAWRDAAQTMFVPYDEAPGVHPQAEQFTDHAVWDFARTGANQYPLLLHFSYFDLYRKQVVKQADLVLALWLRGGAFSPEDKARDFEYYEPLTVRDSSLSAFVQAVVGVRSGTSYWPTTTLARPLALTSATSTTTPAAAFIWHRWPGSGSPLWPGSAACAIMEVPYPSPRGPRGGSPACPSVCASGGVSWSRWTNGTPGTPCSEAPRSKSRTTAPPSCSCLTNR
jgi:hypothetical protein